MKRSLYEYAIANSKASRRSFLKGAAGAGTVAAMSGGLSSIAKNVAVKVPLTVDGLKTCAKLREKNIMVNVTLCFSAAQALLAAKAGASFISPFVGRLDDIGEKGMDLIEDIVIIYENYGFDTEVLVASIRTTQHVIDAALIGAHVSTVPPQIIHELYKHNLTDKGLKAFLDDWAKTGQSILPI